MKALTLLMTGAAVAAVALSAPAEAKSMKRQQMQDQYMRSSGSAPAGFSAQANAGCFKETNKDWGFGYAGACSSGSSAANFARQQDALQYPGGGGSGSGGGVQ